ncbi:helix-turn-helix domain-containing protein [Lentilactobacillus kefiri]|uniref:Uncharacterized protein n=1 Tax=Lentilactobacillus kefiri TaxID=33962 RepID=A0A511DR26_LENKE|nr:helix-turn-helix domain-containing protein [Lentilactobacillus kefiri]KRL56698.1 hypothetical protein FD08_GL004048 [Lentilactobacillus parakefiri DSM 10551]MCJ2160702.1 helix-turn-helix domain-containing protein [Lentilactobacillus kefiri]MCP9367957.1 helix-turn-helix domain-containing protein [Lentilactobacillus kefiri]MDH5107493.1 helix-turn-helix domain-containing protein [Lentilactobacillus kefiri]MDM7491870.1 helix-turn-helix domain-containing protein [Lentilactobacillus kefiri]
MELSILLLIFGSPTQFRRVKAIKNTLRGRRTVSNLYWALQYGMLDFVDSLHGVSFEEDSAALKQLKNDGLVETDDDFRFRLTSKGVKKQLDFQSQLLPLKNLAVGSRYDVAKFMHRFTFAVQIVSEYSYSNNKYYPQSINYFEDQLLKRWFIQNKRHQLPQQFHDLLNDFLSGLGDNQLADAFTQSLVGHDFSGLTGEQVAAAEHTHATIVQLQWLQLYGMLLQELLKLPKDNPLLQLTFGLDKPVVAKSAEETFDLFVKQGSGDFKTIAQQRGIKLTTVYEHLLEMAIMSPINAFPYQSLIAPDLWKRLADNSPEDVGEWSFADASKVFPHLAFFEFRLFQIYRSKLADEN